MPRFAVIGAGLSGAVIARELAQAGHYVDVFEARSHVAGNCHTERDPETGVMMHVYGPHIFHTDDADVWNYVQRFGKFMPYIQRTKAVIGNDVYTLPINLLTINQFFGKNLNPRQAEAYLNLCRDDEIRDPQNFEEQALSMIGQELYEAFFRGYTIKQWGRDPTELPASILKRLPVRFNYDDNYFSHRFQGIPVDGYTELVTRMLTDFRIRVYLGEKFERGDSYYKHTFVTGPIDEWFGYEFGRLPYRTLDFKIARQVGDAQGAAVINYCDAAVPFTRVTEHKHFTPWEHHDQTVTYTEYSRECGPLDEPFYPIRLATEQAQLERYQQLAADEVGSTFVGRLGTYSYLDMDVTISRALSAAREFLTNL
jgi:UDP-galactopyranose mutase